MKKILIPESDLNHIFQPFYRASNVGSVSGKGVGLALAKSILERLGARITVTSRVETGTVFKVSFYEFANKASFACKQALFAIKRSLVYMQKKPCL